MPLTRNLLDVVSLYPTVLLCIVLSGILVCRMSDFQTNSGATMQPCLEAHQMWWSSGEAFQTKNGSLLEEKRRLIGMANCGSFPCTGVHKGKVWLTHDGLFGRWLLCIKRDIGGDFNISPHCTPKSDWSERARERAALPPLSAPSICRDHKAAALRLQTLHSEDHEEQEFSPCIVNEKWNEGRANKRQWVSCRWSSLRN